MKRSIVGLVALLASVGCMDSRLLPETVEQEEAGAVTGRASDTTASKRIALSFDDAPKGPGPAFSGSERTERLLAELAKAGAGPVVFFVTTSRLEEPAGIGRIHRYAAAGHLIANHSHSHRWLRETEAADYIEDMLTAESLLGDFGNRRPWYRFPFLDEGKLREKRDAVREAMHSNGLTNGYVTVDNYDWYLESKWQKALQQGLTVDVDAMRYAYVEMLMSAVHFYDDVATRALDASPVHVLLLHENDLAALFIGDLIDALRDDGWEIVSPDEAYADPVLNAVPKTLMASQGRVAALAIDNGFDNRMLTHLAIEEDQLEALLTRREVFRPAVVPITE